MLLLHIVIIFFVNFPSRSFSKNLMNIFFSKLPEQNSSSPPLGYARLQHLRRAISIFLKDVVAHECSRPRLLKYKSQLLQLKSKYCASPGPHSWIYTWMPSRLQCTHHKQISHWLVTAGSPGSSLQLESS